MLSLMVARLERKGGCQQHGSKNLPLPLSFSQDHPGLWIGLAKMPAESRQSFGWPHRLHKMHLDWR